MLEAFQGFILDPYFVCLVWFGHRQAVLCEHRGFVLWGFVWFCFVFFLADTVQ